MSESKFDPLLGRPRTVDEKVIERVVERMIGGGTVVQSGEGGSGTVSDWGDIGGTLSDQTDLQTALDAKANDSAVVHDTGDETVGGVKTFSSDPIIPDEAYGAGWNGSLEPPTKNAVYDKVEALGGGSVETVVPGNNIDVDATDPANPIVSVETLVAADISDVTASAAELNVLDGIPAGLTATEVGYLDGVTSAIQTQLDAKSADADVVHDTGDETVAGVKTFSSDPIIPDEAYDATGWNGVLEPPTKNAVRDKFESLTGGGQTLVTHIVAASGGTHTTLGAAIAAAANGDTIYIREGTYVESTITTALTDLTIIGENPESSIISFTTTTATFSGARVNFRNVQMTFSSGRLVLTGVDQSIIGCSIVTSGTDITIHPQGDQFRFIGNRVESTGSSSGRLLYIESLYSTFTGNTIEAAVGTGSDTQGTIQLVNADYCTISNNTIDIAASSAAYPGAIIYCASGSVYYTISNNTMRQLGTVLLVGISARGNNGTITGNTINNVAHGIHVVGNDVSVLGNTILASRNGSDQTGMIADGARGLFIGNTLTAGFTQGVGIEIGTGDDDNVFIGNAINSFATGINVSATAQENTIAIGNHIANCTTPVVNSGIGGSWYGNVGTSLIHEKRTLRMKNTSGGALALGDVVILKSVAAGDEVTTTTTAGDDKVFGMAIEAISDNAYGRIQTLGKTVSLKVDGTTDIAIGDFLTTFTTAKIAAKAAAGDMVFAMALEAYTADDSSGVVDALLITPRLI